MRKILSFAVYILLAVPTVKSQILFEENFNNYIAGHLNTDYTGAIAGQGGWYVKDANTGNASAKIIPETSKGNVLIIEINNSNHLYSEGVSIGQASDVIKDLWNNNRTAGNNIMKFEYEYYGLGTVKISGGVVPDLGSDILVRMSSTMFKNSRNVTCEYLVDNVGTNQGSIIEDYSINPVPYNMWVKTELFVDYNTNSVYFYIPMSNTLIKRSFTHNQIPSTIYFYGLIDDLKSSIIKLDNIKLSALQNLPLYILNNDEFITSKFNIFPNPTMDIITITNNENIGIEKIEVFDVSGKSIKAQSYSNENEVQLNVEKLVSGVYMLHIHTNEGMAVKKIVKK